MDGIDSVDYAMLEWLYWLKHRQLLEPIGDTPPAEFGQDYYYRQLEAVAIAA